MKIKISSSLFLLAFVLAACNQPAGGPQAWLDRPLDNSTLPLAALTIQAHASDADGVASFEFYVNDTLLSSVSGSGGRLSEASIEWTPPGAGTYTVKARAVDTGGNAGSYATSVITVDGKLTQHTPTPDALLLDETPVTEAQPAENIPTSVKITGVECAGGLAVNVDISISNPQGIASYKVFSTWVAAETGESFTAPYPQNVDKRIQLTEPFADNVDRDHEIGLMVTLPDNPNPIYAYALEPNNRCPGHYQPPIVVDPSEPTAPLVNATQNANCRRGPSLEYDVIASLLEGQTAEITGRSADGGWWQINHPGLGSYCWISGAVVQVSGDVGGIAVVTAPPLPSTEEPPPSDTTPPTFYNADISPDSILTDGTGCPSYERTITVAAAVADEGGLSSVYATWSVGSESGTVTLVEGGLGYWATIGPVDTAGTMTIMVYAVDTSGNSAQYGPLYVTVQNCIE
ncbi:MAG: SH3 domain-containing protein [Chloroflexi bacterium]|nr:SH3 domain-containing protein [Chloroflexota bacterium]